MCSSLNPQKSIRVDAVLCDGVQAYALAHRLALRPRWFSNFINSAVREKLLREGFLPVDSPSVLDGSDSSISADASRSVRDDFINPKIAQELVRAIRGEGLVGSSTNSVPPDGSRRVLDGADEHGGDVLVEDKKARDRIAQSEEPYLAYLIDKHSPAVADNRDNCSGGFDYPQNPPASVLNDEKVGGKAGVVESQSKARSDFIDGDVSSSANMRKKSSRSTQNRKAR